MRKLSIIIPTKNEEANIGECINSVHDIADEILVVDSYSTDNTANIATELGAKVIKREFDYYSAQKNWAILQAKNEWIFLLDADERLTKTLEIEIKGILSREVIEEVSFWIYRVNYFLGKQVNYSGWQDDKVIRLFLRDKNQYNDRRVHEEIISDGKIGYLQNKINHFTCTKYDKYLEKINAYATLQAIDYKDKTKNITIYHILIKPFFRFLKQYFIKQGFRDGNIGLIISLLGSYAVFSIYVKLWILRNK